MTRDQILEKIKQGKIKQVGKQESSQNEFLFASLALLGAAYSQIRGQGIEMEAAEFWPFGEFKPNQDPKENLVKACNYIISEIERLSVSN